MGARSKSRKRALDILYGADVRGEETSVALAAEAARHAADPKRANSWPYAREIVEGVITHRAEIDELIETYAVGWTLARMPAVDRSLMRIALWEICFNPDVPDGVAIAEAVESARVHSTDDSAGFLNGVLGRVAAGRA